jgi:Rrf2 family protein
MITIPKKVEYSIIFLSFLSKNKNENISLKQASKKLFLPKSFLSKLATLLTNGGLIISQEGKSGGYQLAPNWQKKSFYDLLVILNENKAMVSCLGSKSCVQAGKCSIQKIWLKIETSWQSELKKIKLSQI